MLFDVYEKTMSEGSPLRAFKVDGHYYAAWGCNDILRNCRKIQEGRSTQTDVTDDEAVKLGYVKVCTLTLK